jgi:hypothetical protein
VGSERRPDQIDSEFAPRLRAHVTLVPVQHEAVLFEEGLGRLHQLSPTAAAVCTCFDGTTDLATLIADVVAVFEGDPIRIEADILAMTRDLGAKGLLVGVRGDMEVEVAQGAASGADG